MKDVSVTVHDYGDQWQYTGEETGVRELEVVSSRGGLTNRSAPSAAEREVMTDTNGYEVRMEVTQREMVPWVSAQNVDVELHSGGQRLHDSATVEMTPRITYTEVDSDGYSVYEAYLTNHPLA